MAEHNSISPRWRHQQVAFDRAITVDYFALLMEQGCGKSKTLIDILRYKFNSHKRVLRTLIITPPITLNNWADEWRKNSHLESSKVILLNGSGANRLKVFNQKAYKDGVPQGAVFVTNYETLSMPEVFRAFQEWKPEAIVFDEAQKIKDMQAKRTKLANRLTNGEFTKKGVMLFPPVKYRYILTGTPILNSAMDIFSQFLVLDGGKTFGRNFFIFRAVYFEDKNAAWKGRSKYFPDFQIKPGALDEMNRLIHSVGIRVTKAECLDLPPLVKVPIRVGMTPIQAKLYAEMKRDLVTFLKDKAFTATLAITKALRLQQIASGFCTASDGSIISLGLTPRQEALKELLSEITTHSKVLVWAVFKENYEQIKQVCDSIGVGYVELHGEISATAKQDNIRKFKEDEKIKVFIGHPGSAGIGINLVNASYSIFYSRNFSLEYDKQAEARNHRGGSEIHEKITRYDLIASGTIDELVVTRLSEKEEIGEAMLGQLIESLQKENN